MAKNILIITGSPRKGGNSAQLAEAFAQGARDAGNEVEIFSTADNPVLPCRACECCWTKGTACVYDDGFKTLAPALEKADVVVFATPVYWFTFSAEIKAAIDKLYAFMTEPGAGKLHVSKSYLIFSAEATNENGYFDGIIASYKQICGYLEWEIGDILIADGLGAKDAIQTRPELLEKAKELGKNV